MNHFELFEIPVNFKVDKNILAQKYFSSMMKMATTQAKIGRSIKKRENMGRRVEVVEESKGSKSRRVERSQCRSVEGNVSEGGVQKQKGPEIARISIDDCEYELCD